MAQDSTSAASFAKPLNVVLGGAGIGLLLAAAGFAFMRSQKTSPGDLAGKVMSRKPGMSAPFNPKGKWALNTLIRVIEHDTSRKMLLGVLKAMAKRAK